MSSHAFLCAFLHLWLCLQSVNAVGSFDRPEHEHRVSHVRREQAGQPDRKFFKFVTRPDIDAPVWNIKKYDESATALGYWFLAPYESLAQARPGDAWAGPHIYRDNGELVWSGTPTFNHWNIFDFGTSEVNGSHMLTLLSEHDRTGYILNSSYRIHQTVPLLSGDESKPNMHSFHVVDDGKRALILNLHPIMTSKEVSQVVGFDGNCDAKYQGFRELDLESPDTPTLFEWDAIDHIGLDESTHLQHDGTIEDMCTKGWDILHFNSIDKFPNGDYLLSARHTDAVYKISHVDGSIIWRLGGVKSDFDFVGGRNFSRQHHARIRDHNETHTTITLFDNAIGDDQFEKASHEQSQGLVLSLDTSSMKAEITAQYDHPKGKLTNARGSFQTLANGNAFICWAYWTQLSEHTPDGKLAMEAILQVPAHSYRAFKSPWVGEPSQPPDIHSYAILDLDNVRTIVHVSWNGDTRTKKWNLKEVDDQGRVTAIADADKDGFETAMYYGGYAKTVFVEALDGEGNVLGKSEVAVAAYPSPLEAGSSEHHESEEFETDLPSEDSKEPPSKQSLQSPLPVFFFGIVCSAAVGAILWGLSRLRKRGGKVLWQREETKYTPLEQDREEGEGR